MTILNLISLICLAVLAYMFLKSNCRDIKTMRYYYTRTRELKAIAESVARAKELAEEENPSESLKELDRAARLISKVAEHYMKRECH